MNKSKLLGFLLCLLSGTACKKSDSTGIGSQWFQKDALFQYESADTNGTVGLVNLYVESGVYSSDKERILFIEGPADSATNTPHKIVFQNFDQFSFRKKADGLYQEAVTDCSVGLIHNSFDFLAIPANPAVGTTLQLYGCGKQPAGQNQILNADTLINVPSGTYHTFSILHPNADISYWNRDVGIIQYEVYEHDPTRTPRKLITLKLQRVQ